MTVEGAVGVAGKPFRHDASRVVVRDAAGRPVAVVLEYGGVVMAAVAGGCSAADFADLANLANATPVQSNPESGRGPVS